MTMNRSVQPDMTPVAPAPGSRRRGFFVAAAALMAGLIAKVTEQPVEAGVDGDVVLGASNTATTPTVVTNSASNSVGLQGVCTTGTIGFGLLGYGSIYGVVGNQAGSTQNTSGAGVIGQSSQAAGWGVAGNNAGTGTPCVGVRGVSFNSTTGIGVFGQGRGSGLFGQITPGSTDDGIAIYGLNNSSYAGPGPGAGGFGVYGLSAKGHGLVGATAAPGAAAVVGATNGVAGAFAAAFYGPVLVGGDLTVVGGAKSAAVSHPDGTLRRLYCVESPESWFEDFGKGQLACGETEVAIDPTFAAVADLRDYHVFLTGYDDFELRVSEQTTSGFRVQAKDGTSAGRFSWRVVAKRKDIAGPRFEAVTVPPAPTLPPIPDFPTPPVPPRIPRRG